MFKLEIDTGNEAFNYDCELARIIRGVSRTLAEMPDCNADGVVRDMNGNTVGRWEFVPDLEEDDDEDSDGPPEWEVTETN